jgi:EAL domain-containing protein (putative c-di-GMP-specific phosphodiesterase class I)
MPGSSLFTKAKQQIVDRGVLCLSPTVPHALPALASALDEAGVAFRRASFAALLIPLSPGLLRDLAPQLESRLPPAELRQTRALVVQDESAVTLSDLVSMIPLSTFLARVSGEWFTEMIRDNRFASHFQPIVRASDPTMVFAHECLLRGVMADGSLIPPARLYETARVADMLFPLDLAARLSAIRTAVEHGIDRTGQSLFINFNPSAVHDPALCLRSTLSAIARSEFQPRQIIFEIAESDHAYDVTHLLRIAKFYREAGFRIAVDDLGAGYGSINLLSELRPEYVKFDMHLIRNVDQDPYKANVLRNLLNMTQMLEITSVAEGIETEGEWHWAREHGADFVQGFYFARPASHPFQPATKLNVLQGPHIHKMQEART